MNIISKPRLNLQCVNFNTNIIDINTHYVCGQHYYPKTLDLPLTDVGFFIQDAAGEPYILPCGKELSTKTVIPFMLKGESNLTNLPAWLSTGFNTDFNPYFESTLGITAGKRFIFYYYYSEIMPCVFENTKLKVLKYCQYFASHYTTLYFHRCSVFAESVSHFYIFTQNLVGNTKFYSLHKETYTLVELHAISGGSLTFLQRTEQGLWWFGVSTVTSLPNGKHFYYIILDTELGVLSTSVQSSYATTPSQIKVYSPPSAATSAGTGLMKIYVAVDPESITPSVLKVKVAVLNTTSMSISSPTEFTVSAWQSCIVTDSPLVAPIYSEVPYYYNTTNSFKHGQAKTWQCSGNGSEYVCVAWIGTVDPSYKGNTILARDPTRQGLYLLKVDPADPTKLVYVSVLGNFTTMFTGIMVEKNTIILTNDYGFQVVVFDAATETFIAGSFNEFAAMRYLLDANEVLWAEDLSAQIYTFQIANSVQVGLRYSVPYLDLVTAGSECQVLVKATNLVGKLVAATVTLVANNAIFSNDEDVITVTTLETGELTVELKVADATSVTVTPLLESIALAASV